MTLYKFLLLTFKYLILIAMDVLTSVWRNLKKSFSDQILYCSFYDWVHILISVKTAFYSCRLLSLISGLIVVLYNFTHHQCPFPLQIVAHPNSVRNPFLTHLGNIHLIYLCIVLRCQHLLIQHLLKTRLNNFKGLMVNIQVF